MTDPVIHLHRGGTSVVVDLRDGRLPRILHWGPDLGALDAPALVRLADAVQPTIGDSAVTYPQPIPVVPLLAEGWFGRPGLAGARPGGRGFAPLFAGTTTSIEEAGGVTRVRSAATDSASQLSLVTELELDDAGVLRLAVIVENTGNDSYRVEALEPALPVPAEAAELLDLTGRWAREKVPQRHPFPVGAWLRESRGGKPGLDHTGVLIAGEPGFGFRRGRVWGVHLGWSGNQSYAAERMPAGTRSLRAGELLLPGEVELEPGESLRSPWLYGSWGEGLDQLATRFHRHVRARPTHPSSPRPVLVNTWEAVYFQHDPAKLLAFAERSAELGAERFVVDDGWFRGRRDDTTALGDWIVDEEVWPDGLGPLADRVHELGMQFGLWVEPEMVNLDSDLAREHPDWVFDAGHGAGLPSRYQHVLDLGHEDAYQLVLERISGLVTELGIDYLKWDHNRYLTDACHAPGGRADLGVLEHSDRVWPSDDNDPHDRVDVHRWMGLLLPPELLGTHVGAEESHTTRRVAPLDFRAATAFWGNLGVELDLTTIDSDQFERMRAWVSAHRELRDLLHSGEVVHADTVPEVRLDGVVAADRSAALYQFVVLDRPATWPPERLRLPGLDPVVEYDVVEYAPGEPVPAGQRPPWLDSGVRLSGRVLETVGLEAPSLDADRSMLIRLTAAR